MKSILCALVLSLVSAKAANDLVVNWNAIPAGESNILYRVYVSTNGAAATFSGSTTGTSFAVLNIPAGTYCAQVTSSNIWQESAKSPLVCSVGPVIVPSVPNGVTVTIRVQ
jgi:hypothetical protein